VPAAEDFVQYKLQFIDAIHHDYEVIRPLVLFAETIAERRRQTGLERTVVGEKARRFVMEGMLGLVDQRAGHAGRQGHVYPEAVATYMWYVKQLYPPIHACEIVRIVARKFGYQTNHHTVKRFFERYPVPLPWDLPMPAFADCADAYQARWTIVRMWYEGWNKKSIAGCLKLSRRLCRKFCSGRHAGAVALVCGGITRPGRRTVRPQCGPRLQSPRPSVVF
jgi:hypothetical protein